MDTLDIKNQEQLEIALDTFNQAIFEYDGLLFYVERPPEVDYFFRVFELGTDIEESRANHYIDALDSGFLESSYEGLFELMTANSYELKNRIYAY